MGSAASKLGKPAVPAQLSKSAAKDAALGQFLAENLRVKVTQEPKMQRPHSQPPHHPEARHSAFQTRVTLNAEALKHPERFISWDELPGILSKSDALGGTKAISPEKLAELKQTLKLVK